MTTPIQDVKPNEKKTSGPSDVQGLLIAVALPMAMLATITATVAYHEREINRIDNQIVQPILDAACEPASANAFVQEREYTPLAAYVLIKNPGKFKAICSALNRRISEKNVTTTDLDNFNPPPEPVLEQLALSLGMTTPEIKSLVPTRPGVTYYSYKVLDKAYQATPPSSFSP